LFCQNNHLPPHSLTFIQPQFIRDPSTQDTPPSLLNIRLSEKYT
jgi:hypothetical protein